MPTYSGRSLLIILASKVTTSGVSFLGGFLLSALVRRREVWQNKSPAQEERGTRYWSYIVPGFSSASLSAKSSYAGENLFLIYLPTSASDILL